MSKKEAYSNLTEEYQKLTYEKTPDLWERISKGIDDGLYAEGSEKFLPKEEEIIAFPAEKAGAEAVGGVKKTARIKRYLPYVSVVAAAAVVVAFVGPMFFGTGGAKKSANGFANMSVTMDAAEPAAVAKNESKEANESYEYTAEANGVAETTPMLMTVTGPMGGTESVKDGSDFCVILGTVHEITDVMLVKSISEDREFSYVLMDSEGVCRNAVLGYQFREGDERCTEDRATNLVVGKHYTFTLSPYDGDEENWYWICEQPVLVALP